LTLEETEIEHRQAFKYGEPVESVPEVRRKRYNEYDECLEEFLASGAKVWKVNMDSLPKTTYSSRVSSFRYRVFNYPRYRNIGVFSYKGNIYLQKLDIHLEP